MNGGLEGLGSRAAIPTPPILPSSVCNTLKKSHLTFIAAPCVCKYMKRNGLDGGSGALGELAFRTERSFGRDDSSGLISFPWRATSIARTRVGYSAVKERGCCSGFASTTFSTQSLQAQTLKPRNPAPVQLARTSGSHCSTDCLRCQEKILARKYRSNGYGKRLVTVLGNMIGLGPLKISLRALCLLSYSFR